MGKIIILLTVLCLSFGAITIKQEQSLYNFASMGMISYGLKATLPDDLPIRKDLIYNSFYGAGLGALSDYFECDNDLAVLAVYGLGWEVFDFIRNDTTIDWWDVLAYAVGYYSYKGVFNVIIDDRAIKIPILEMRF